MTSVPTYHHIRINQTLGMNHRNAAVVKDTEAAKLTIRYIQDIICETGNTKTNGNAPIYVFNDRDLSCC